MDLRDVFSRVWTSSHPLGQQLLSRGRLAFVMSSCYYNFDFRYQD